MASRNWRWVRISAVALGAFSLGMAVRGPDPPGTTAEPRGDAKAVPAPARAGVRDQVTAGPGPTVLTSGIPVGYARSPEGAVAAAVAYMATGQAVLDMSPAEVGAAVHTMATSQAAGQILADTRARLAAARTALAGGDAPVEYRQAALAVRVDAFDQERARVAVWNVGVLARDGVAPPQAGWAISTFDLVWERSDWKVAAEVIEPGPAPVTNAAVAPATSAELSRRLAGFSPYGSRP